MLSKNAIKYFKTCILLSIVVNGYFSINDSVKKSPVRFFLPAGQHMSDEEFSAITVRHRSRAVTRSK